MITTDLSKQQALDADPKGKQQINLKANSKRDVNESKARTATNSKNQNDLLQLSFTLKISIFLEACI